MVDLKKRSHSQKPHPKWWTPQIKLGNAEEEEKKNSRGFVCSKQCVVIKEQQKSPQRRSTINHKPTRTNDTVRNKTTGTHTTINPSSCTRALNCYQLPQWPTVRLLLAGHPYTILDGDQGPVSWRSTTAKWRQFSQSNRHSTIGTRQTQYHEALPSSADMQSHLTMSFTDDGNASWYSVCRVPMVEWRLDCEDCRHSTVVGLRDTGPWCRFTARCLPMYAAVDGKSSSLLYNRHLNTDITSYHRVY